MFDSQKELLQEIALGESAFLDFKEVRFRGNKVSGPDRDKLADGLAAFANSRGGVFVLGVEDQIHEVVGIPLERLDGVSSTPAKSSLSPFIRRSRMPSLID